MKDPAEKLIPFPMAGRALYHAEDERALCVVARQIAAARKRKGISMKELQRQLKLRGVEVGYASIVRWEAGETVPNAYQLLAICNALEIPDAYSYFMNGAAELNEEGLRKLAAYREDLIASGRYAPVSPSKPKRAVTYVEMPVSTLGASAGTGEFLDSENIVMMRFPESGVPAGADFAVRVVGDSMEPIYQNNQLVWVHICNTLNPGDVGIFVLDGEGYIKAYDEREPDADASEDYLDSDGVMHRQVVLQSYNPKYEPRIVRPSSGFKICGRVLN